MKELTERISELVAALKMYDQQIAAVETVMHNDKYFDAEVQLLQSKIDQLQASLAKLHQTRANGESIIAGFLHAKRMTKRRIKVLENRSRIESVRKIMQDMAAINADLNACTTILDFGKGKYRKCEGQFFEVIETSSGLFRVCTECAQFHKEAPHVPFHLRGPARVKACSCSDQGAPSISE